MQIDVPTISVTPPESLVRFEAPLFVGVEPNLDSTAPKGNQNENNSKLEDMVYR